jgi:hypothetical protein
MGGSGLAAIAFSGTASPGSTAVPAGAGFIGGRSVVPSAAFGSWLGSAGATRQTGSTCGPFGVVSGCAFSSVPGIPVRAPRASRSANMARRSLGAPGVLSNNDEPAAESGVCRDSGAGGADVSANKPSSSALNPGTAAAPGAGAAAIDTSDAADGAGREALGVRAVTRRNLQMAGQTIAAVFQRVSARVPPANCRRTSIAPRSCRARVSSPALIGTGSQLLRYLGPVFRLDPRVLLPSRYGSFDRDRRQRNARPDGVSRDAG